MQVQKGDTFLTQLKRKSAWTIRRQREINENAILSKRMENQNEAEVYGQKESGDTI
jgi:hypothetical protein